MTAIDGELAYRHAEQVEFRETEGEVFLVGADGQSLYHLNVIGSAIWRLLAEPTSAAEAAEILQEAFPDVAPERINADVKAIFADLLTRSLIACA